MIVFDDADIEEWSKVYVHLAITMPDRIVLRLSDLRAKRHLRYAGGKTGCWVATLKSGAPDDESTELGPLTRWRISNASARQ